MPDPALVFRRTTLARVSGTWQHEDYHVFDGNGDVGRIYLIGSNSSSELWFWSAGFQLTDRKSYGLAASLDAAKGAFRAEYEAWKSSGG
jgi:hypothetical protein